MTTLSPWINFNGNAEEAFTFYKSVFGGEFTKIIRFKDLAGPEFQVSEKESNKIMQIVLTVGKGTMLIGNDVPEFMGTVSEAENRSKIYVATENKEEARRIFTQLSLGGQIEGAPSENPNEPFFATFRDTYGIEWIIEFNPEN